MPASAGQSAPSVDLDLDAYAARLGIVLPDRLDADALRRLHAAHLAAIPFENLDVQLGRPIRIDPASVVQKLVHGRRGGYCFEQNTLFMHVLRALGARVTPHEARVRSGATSVLPRTHMTLAVTVGKEKYLCDVGFGGYSPLYPVPLNGEAVTQSAWTYRVTSEGVLRVLQWFRNGRWEDLYAIEPGERYDVDFEMANWFTSTWPQSRFVLTLTAQRALVDVRHVLRNLTYTEDHGDAVFTRDITRAELLPLLRNVFGLDLPDDARFRALDTASA